MVTWFGVCPAFWITICFIATIIPSFLVVDILNGVSMLFFFFLDEWSLYVLQRSKYSTNSCLKKN
jgi:hypothetical protein